MTTTITTAFRRALEKFEKKYPKRLLTREFLTLEFTKELPEAQQLFLFEFQRYIIDVASGNYRLTIPPEKFQAHIKNLRHTALFLQQLYRSQRQATRAQLQQVQPQITQETSAEVVEPVKKVEAPKERTLRRRPDDGLTSLDRRQLVQLFALLQQYGIFLPHDFLPATKLAEAAETLTGYSKEPFRQALSKQDALSEVEKVAIVEVLKKVVKHLEE